MNKTVILNNGLKIPMLGFGTWCIDDSKNWPRDCRGRHAHSRADRNGQVKDSEATDQPTEPKFEPYKGKIRKPGTGCVTMINDHLYEGRFSPRVNGKRIARNIYATTREECEEKLKVLIAEMKKEIAEIKAGEKATNKGWPWRSAP